MTPEAQRIAIAEACGWKPEIRRAEIPEADFVHEETFWIKDNETRRGPWLPDYLNDLNAMQEARKALTKEQCSKYADILCDQAAECDLSPNIAELFFLTAPQRAEAFLRTINKWTDQ